MDRKLTSLSLSYGQGASQIKGQLPALHRGERPVLEVPDTLQVLAGLVQRSHRPGGQGHHKGLVLAHGVRHDEPLEPGQRV